MAERNSDDLLASLRKIRQAKGEEAYSQAWKQLSHKEQREVLGALKSGKELPIGTANNAGFNIGEYVNRKVGKIIGIFLVLMIVGGIVMTWTIGIAVAGLLQGNGWALLVPAGVSSVLAVITVFVLLSWLLSTILHGVRTIVEETTFSNMPHPQ